MKTCQECGEQVNDNVLTCPNCGATVVMHVTGLSLKGEGKTAKKKTNPMGMSVGGGSGLTDILRSSGPETFDDDFYDSAPVVLKEKPDYEDTSGSSKGGGKVFSKVFKILFWIAVLYGCYVLAMHLIDEAGKKQSRDEAYKMYVEAVSSRDAEVPKDIVPPYEKYDEYLKSEHITLRDVHTIIRSEVKSSSYLSDAKVDKINTQVKLETGKNAKIKEVCVVEMEYIASDSRIYTEALAFVRIKNCWYLDSGKYINLNTEDD